LTNLVLWCIIRYKLRNEREKDDMTVLVKKTFETVEDGIANMLAAAIADY
jgi:hypothetical protein